MRIASKPATGDDVPGITRVVLPCSGFVEAAAREITRRNRHRWPDLSDLLVLVPDIHCAADVARALSSAGGGGPLLLPRIVPLHALAATVPLPYRVTPKAVREVELYALLARRAPFADMDVWALASELVDLFDRMTLARSPIARDAAQFSDSLRAAYRAGRNRALEFEASLVHELWWAQAPQLQGRQRGAGAPVSAAGGKAEGGKSARAAGMQDPVAGEGGDAGNFIDAASAYALRLAALAGHIESPVYAVALEPPHAIDREFLVACAARVPVVHLDPAYTEGDPPFDRALELAWTAAPESPAHATRPVNDTARDAAPATGRASLRERAAMLAAACPDSPLAGRVSFAAAQSLEEQACAIDVAVRQALVEGRTEVGVVVLDRLVARRARALLERAGVAVADEAGWLLSTTVAAACVGRLLDVAASRGYHRDLVDLLRSPFVFNDLPLAARHAALACIEGTLARNDLVDGLPAMIALFGSGKNEDEDGFLLPDASGPDDFDRAPSPGGAAGAAGRVAERLARRLLERVGHALEVLEAGTRKPLADWLDALLQALEILDARSALAADAAGADLLDLMGVRRGELRAQQWRAGFAQWRAWFARTLEAASFRPNQRRDAVVFTYLAATRLRTFDQVVLAGADAAHLPANDPPGSFFNQAVRARLGLPTRELARQETERSLRLLLASAPRVLVIWQARLGGEPNLLSPWFARLQALHREAYPAQSLAFTAALRRSAVAAPPTSAPVRLPRTSGAPAPAAPPGRRPARISVSGYEALVACPYRYYAGTLLGLRPSDEVSESLEKSDFGELVHAILAQFHREVPEVTAIGRESAVEHLRSLSHAAFVDVVRRNFIDRAWLARWAGSIPAYVEWQLGREAGGWRVLATEAERSVSLATPHGRTIVLTGRLDRIDQQRPAGESAVVPALAVIDYKAQGAVELVRRAGAPGEHVQLPAYALLAGAGTVETLFLSIARDQVSPCASAGDPGAAARANGERLARLADRLHESAPMPANGIDKVCDYCEVRGLCRRDFWFDEAAGEQPLPRGQLR